MHLQKKSATLHEGIAKEQVTTSSLNTIEVAQSFLQLCMVKQDFVQNYHYWFFCSRCSVNQLVLGMKKLKSVIN